MERLEINCDFNTQQAAENAAALARALAEIKGQVTMAGEAFNKTASEVGNMGDRAAAAAAPMTKFSGATQEAGREAGTSSQQFNQFNQQVNNTSSVVNNATTTVNNFKAANDQASDSVSVLSGRLGSLVTSYVGLQTVMRLVQQINEQAVAAVDARDKLVGEKLSVDQSILPFMAKKGLSGPQDEARVRTMLFGASRRTLADPATVISGMSAGQGAGFNVDPDKGNPSVEEAIAFAKRTGMNPASTGDLIKLMGQRKDQQGAAFNPQQFLAQIQAGAQDASQDLGQYVSGILTATEGRAAMGGSWGQGLALYGGATGVMRDPGAASTLSARISQMAAGRQEKSVALLAGAAGQFGFIPNPRSGDVNKIAAAELAGKGTGDAEEARLVEQINREGGSLSDLNGERANEQSAYEQHISRLKREWPNRGRSGAMIAGEMSQADAEHNLRRQRIDQSITQSTQKLNDNNAKLRAHITSRLQQQDFLNLPQDQKEQVLLKLLQESGGDPAMREALIQSGVVDSRTLSNMIAVAGPGGRRAMNATGALVGSASGASIARDREGFGKRDLGVAAAANVKSIKDVVDRTSPEDVFNKSMDQKIDVEVQNSRKNLEFADTRLADPFEIFGKVDPSRGEDSSYSMFTQGGKDSYVKSRTLLQQMKKFWDSLTPEEQKQHHEILESFQAAEGEMRKTFWKGDDVADADTRSHYSDLRNAENVIARERAQRSAPPRMAPAAPAPAATQPAGSPVSYHITTHIGSVYTHSPDLELPGALEEA